MKAAPCIITILFGISLQACFTDSSHKIEPVEKGIDKLPNNYIRKEYSDSAFKYVIVDSANYVITQKYFLNDDLFVIHKVDTINKIDTVTYFNNNEVSYTGQRTHPNGVAIGKWSTHSHSFSLIDINYDDSLDVNYSEAIDLALKNGFRFPNIEVTIVEYNDETYWGIYRVFDSQIPQSILIDCKTGDVKKYELNLKTNSEEIRF